MSRWGSLTDVPGVAVGHATRIGDGWLSGVSVVLPPAGTTGAVCLPGGAPATHETDALDPTTLVPTVDAVVFTGGSAYGLAAAGGAQRWCEEHGRGHPVGPPGAPGSVVVPIVPAAAIFDLGRGGDVAARPGADLGYAAARSAGTSGVLTGCVGAGTGALLAGTALKGGVGTASVRLPGGIVVGALAVVNALGSPADPVTGALLGTAFVPSALRRPRPPSGAEADALREALAAPARHPLQSPAGSNTTLCVVATNARADPGRLRRVASSASAALARAFSVAYTLRDGDAVFALATGEEAPSLVQPDALALDAAAADALLLALLDAVLSATRTRSPAIDVPGYLDVCPSVWPVVQDDDGGGGS